jgi:hypothetical protein
MYRFGLGSSPKELRNLIKTLPISLFGKGEVFSVGLRFTRKGILQII